MPWPDGPVLNFRKRVLPSISAWPGSPPRRRSLSRSSQVSAQRPSSGRTKAGSGSRSARARITSFSTASVAYTSGTVWPALSTKRSANGRHGRRMSQRMAPDRRSDTNMCTFERDPPGWPDWR